MVSPTTTLTARGLGAIKKLHASGMGDFVKRYLLGFVLAFVGLASVLFIASALHGMNQLARVEFFSQADSDAAGLQIEVDHLLLRVKDAANYVNSGVGDLQLEKVRNPVNGSRYVTDLGYLATRDGQRHSLAGNTDSTPARAGEVARLAAIAHTQPGYAFVVDTNDYPGLFGKDRQDALVLVQGLPRAAPDEKLTYVVFDFRQMCRDTAARSDFSNTYLIHIVGQKIDQNCSVPRVNNGLIKPETVTHRIPITRTVGVEMHTERLVPMLEGATTTAIFGLLAILAIALTAWLSQRWRSQSSNVLMEAVYKAQVSATAKDEFLANMSHEIRTPLNGILGMAELMGRCNLDETGRRYLDQIRNSGSTLLAILNDVLDLAKIDNGMLAIDPIRTNLYQLFQDIMGLYTGKAMEKNVSLMVDIDTTVPKWAMIDPTRLRQIVGNLISNAVKFTENGEVFVHIATGMDQNGLENLIVSVRDTGIGISPEQQSALFERFAQAEAGTARKFGGTGLGLSITRQLCLLMNGSISLESQTGKGSTFIMRLPLERLEGDQAAATMASVGVGLITPSVFVRQVVERILTKAGLRIHCFATLAEARTALVAGNMLALSGLIVDEAHDIHTAHDAWQQIAGQRGMVGRGWALLLADQQAHYRYTAFDKALTKPFLPDDMERALSVLIHRNQSELAAAAPAIQARSDGPYSPFGPDVSTKVRFDGKRCLVVDDNSINQMVISELMETFGFTIVTASDGKKALAAAVEHPCDIIMMDCRMPNMDGYDATRQLRAMMRAGTLPSIPIVALTANAMKGDSEKCLEAGMDAFLSKPVRLPELVDVLVCLLPMSDAAAPSGDVLWLSGESKDSAADQRGPLETMPVWETPAALPAHTAPVPAMAPMAQPFAPSPLVPPVSPIAAAPAAPAAHLPAQPANPVMTDDTPSLPGQTFASSPPVAPSPMPAQTAARLPFPEAQMPLPPPPPPAPPPPPRPDASRTVSLFDDSTFTTLRQTMRAFPALVGLYRTDTQTYLQQIDDALSLGDKGEAVLPAHTIKSSSKIIGATGMAALAETMESRLRSGVRDSMEELTELSARMQTTYGHTMARIEGLLMQ